MDKRALGIALRIANHLLSLAGPGGGAKREEGCPYCDFFREASQARSYLQLQSEFCDSEQAPLPKGVGGTVVQAREHLLSALNIFNGLPVHPKGVEAREWVRDRLRGALLDLQGMVGCREVLAAKEKVEDIWRVAGNLALARYGCPTCILMRRGSDGGEVGVGGEPGGGTTPEEGGGA